ncbi:hypothetical protein RND71_017616 [Anisodus tanguticus]|uniref:NAC domain-containing protein n=1 Tax=Anisodus tanguticus TaxID=243964 RepID=A0AAE1S2P2_9SOLA|nr:hypothetical protein RND71_017616 [Anisodus tanguticus]
MSTTVPARRLVMGVRFHPTDAELINYLKRFLKGESFPSQCPIRLAEIYGDQPPSAIFGEEKVGYFISPLKKRKKSDERYCRTCANGTWRGQTSGKPIENRKGTVLGFRNTLKYQISNRKEKKQNSSTNWLMREYLVGDDFFRENDIPKQDFVVCRIKKIIKEKKLKDVAVTEQDVDGIIDATLHGPDDNCTTHPAEDQVMDETDKWDLIINGVCDQQVQGHGADGNINEFWEAMNGILEDISIDIPDDLWLDDQSPLLLDK